MGMMKSLPLYYKKSKVVQDIYDAAEKAIDIWQADIDNAIAGFYITKTSDFTLHEKDVGITAASTDPKRRRANVIARLQGNGILTVEELKTLIEAYGENVDVSEDYSNYTVQIVFSNCEGQPKNIDDILAAIEEVKPAHIRIGTGYVRNPQATPKVGGLMYKEKTIELTKKK